MKSKYFEKEIQKYTARNECILFITKKTIFEQVFEEKNVKINLIKCVIYVYCIIIIFKICNCNNNNVYLFNLFYLLSIIFLLLLLLQQYENILTVLQYENDVECYG